MRWILAATLFTTPVFAQDATTLDTVTVTVQKRPENAQMVPMSMTVLDKEQLDNFRVDTVSDMQRFAPNMKVSAFNGMNSITLRGVGGGGRNVGFDPRVGVYLDQVYVGQSQALDMPWLDLEQAVVLSGPQGHLFGRNAIAGAVVLTSSPSTDYWTGRAQIGVGDFNQRQFSATASGPVGESKMRASFHKQSRDGTLVNDADGSRLDNLDRWGGRVKFEWERDDWSLVLSADHQRVDHDIPLGQARTTFFGLPFLPSEENAPRHTSVNRQPRLDLTVGGVAANASYDWNGWTLQSITAHRNTDQIRDNDTDYSDADLIYSNYKDRFSQTSQEFRIISDVDAPVSFVGGMYLAREKARTDRLISIGNDMNTLIPVAGLPVRVPFGMAFRLTPGFGARSDATVNTDIVAAFGSVMWKMNDQWTIEAGGRYSYERKDLQMNLDGSGSGSMNLATIDTQDKRQESIFSPRVSAIWSFSDQWNAYATYSTGFKSGGWNVDFLSVPQAQEDFSFAQETVDNIEVGLKGAGQQWAMDAVLFYAQYDDLQVPQFIALPTGGSITQLRNAAKATTQGAELRGRYIVGPLTFGATAGVVDARFDRFPNGGGTGIDLGGNRLPEAPKRNASLTVDYSQPFNTGALGLHADYHYRSDWYALATNLQREHVSSSTTTNAAVSWSSANNPWKITAYVRNVFDQNNIELSNRDFFGHDIVQYQLPRMTGVEFSWDF